MVRASSYFSAAEVESIESAIVDAENKTTGEIVVAVASRSGQYDRGEDIFGLFIALISVAVAWLVFQRFQVDTTGWAPSASASLGLLSVLGIFVGGFVLGAFAATRIPILATFLSTRKEMKARVKNQATAAFHQLAVRRTGGASGVLIYISLLERTIWVVGDDTISDRVDSAVWDEARAMVVDGFRDKRAAHGLQKAITHLGGVLETELPVGDGDVNELHNRLRFLD